MNRNEEWKELKNELNQTPVELEYTAAKAIARAKSKKRRSLLFRTPLISFCSFVITFIVFVNLFPAAALAMSESLGLKELIRAVAVNPNLKRAVEHDYYQEIGESQIQDDVKVTADYMILDAGNITLFFHVDAPVKAGLYHCEFLGPDSKPLEAGFYYTTGYETGKLQNIEMQFPGGNRSLPEEVTFKITVNKDENYRQTMESQIKDNSTPYLENKEVEETGKEYAFTFKLYPDKQFSNIVDTIPVNQWIEIKGQRIYLGDLFIYPSNVRLSVTCDDKNTSAIESLDVCLEDEKGTKYPGFGSLLITNDPDKQELQYVYFESSYFADAHHLKLYLNGISMIDKKKLYGKISYSDKTIENIPDWISIDSMELKDSTLYFTLKEKRKDIVYNSAVIDSSYYEQNGMKHNFGTWSLSTSSDKKTNYNYFKIENYKDNFYKIRWYYHYNQPLDEAIIIDLK